MSSARAWIGRVVFSSWAHDTRCGRTPRRQTFRWLISKPGMSLPPEDHTRVRLAETKHPDSRIYIYISPINHCIFWIIGGFLSDTSTWQVGFCPPLKIRGIFLNITEGNARNVQWWLWRRSNTTLGSKLDFWLLTSRLRSTASHRSYPHGKLYLTMASYPGHFISEHSDKNALSNIVQTRRWLCIIDPLSYWWHNYLCTGPQRLIVCNEWTTLVLCSCVLCCDHTCTHADT